MLIWENKTRLQNLLHSARISLGPEFSSLSISSLVTVKNWHVGQDSSLKINKYEKMVFHNHPLNPNVFSIYFRYNISMRQPILPTPPNQCVCESWNICAAWLMMFCAVRNMTQTGRPAECSESVFHCLAWTKCERVKSLNEITPTMTITTKQPSPVAVASPTKIWYK